MKTKKCSHKKHKGKKELEIVKFSPHPNTKSGRQSICRECNRRLAKKRARKISLKKKREKGKDPALDYKEPNYDVKDIKDVEDFKDYPDDVLICDL